MKEKNRKDIDKKYKWDLNEFFNNGKDFDKACKEVLKSIEKIHAFKGNLVKNADTLLEFLEFQEELEILIEKIYVYGNYYSYHPDTRDSNGQKIKDQVFKIYLDYIEAVSFVENEILSKDITELINKNVKLKKYEKHLNDIVRFKPHILSLKEEELLAKAEEVLRSGEDLYENLLYADVDFGKIKDENNKIVELNAANYSLFLQNKNRNLRKRAYKKRNGFYKKFYNTIVSTYKATIKSTFFISEARNYKDPLDRDLISNNLNRKVFDTLINTVGGNTNDIKRFYELKRKMLNLNTLHRYDFGAIPNLNVNDTISYEDALIKIKKALTILGNDYISVAESYLNNNMIDVYPSKGKYTGGYQVNTYKEMPRILYNYRDTFSDFYGLIHEIGHAMHSYYTNKFQPFIYSANELIAGETASLTNEVILTNYLTQNAKSKDEKIYYLIKHLEQIDNYLFGTITNAIHEHKLYECEKNGEPLSNEDVCKIYYDLKKKHYGSKHIIIDEEENYSFMRYGHYHTSYYFYKYAIGMSAALIIGDNLFNKKDFKEKYIDFLSRGCSLKLEELYKILDINLEDEKTYLNAINYFKKKVDELETLINS